MKPTVNSQLPMKRLPKIQPPNRKPEATSTGMRRSWKWIAVLGIAVVGFLATQTTLWDRLIRYPRLEAQRADWIESMSVPHMEDGYSTYRVQILPQPISSQELREIVSRNKELDFDAFFLVQPEADETVRFVPGQLEEIEGTWLYYSGNTDPLSPMLDDVLPFTGDIIYDAFHDVLSDESHSDPLSTVSIHFSPIAWGERVFTVPIDLLANWERKLTMNSVLGVSVAGGGSTYQKYLSIKNQRIEWNPGLLGNVCNYVLVQDDVENPDTPENLDPFPVLLWESLQQGHVYVVAEWLAPAPEVVFQVDSPVQIDGMAQMGDVVPLTRNLMLYAEVPLPCRMNLMRNGEVILSEDDVNNLEFELKDTGVYRLETQLYFNGKYQPWIYTNPITIEMVQPQVNAL